MTSMIYFLVTNFIFPIYYQRIQSEVNERGSKDDRSPIESTLNFVDSGASEGGTDEGRRHEAKYITKACFRYSYF